MALSSAALAEIPDELLTSPLAEAFGAGPTIDRPRLSPDGTKMLFLQQRPGGGTEVRTIDLAELEQRLIVSGGLTGYDIEWCEWGNPTRLVCDMILAIDYDGGQPRQLDRGYVVPALEGSAGCRIIAEVSATRRVPDSLPENPDHMATDCSGLGMVDIYTGKYLDRRAGPGVISAVLSDGRGQPRLQRYTLVNRQFDRWLARTDLDSEWFVVDERDPTIFEDPFRPVGFGFETNRLFHLATASGRWALYSMDLARGPDSELAFAHPQLDIEHVDTFGPYDRVIAAAWLDGRPQRFIVDDRAAEVYATAEELLPQHNIEVVDESWDRNYYLVLARRPGRAGDYYLLDIQSGELTLIGAEYERLADVTLAETTTISFPSADGGTITGHLTLPANRCRDYSTRDSASIGHCGPPLSRSVSCSERLRGAPRQFSRNGRVWQLAARGTRVAGVDGGRLGRCRRGAYSRRIRCRDRGPHLRPRP
jgi:dipeptidyl aminopeptidase/acylaminoacyl peptidase